MTGSDACGRAVGALTRVERTSPLFFLLLLPPPLMRFTLLLATIAQGVQLETLFRRQHLTHVQQHERACLVQRRARRLDSIDLPRHFERHFCIGLELVWWHGKS